jgi:hypothetical protein
MQTNPAMLSIFSLSPLGSAIHKTPRCFMSFFFTSLFNPTPNFHLWFLVRIPPPPPKSYFDLSFIFRSHSPQNYLVQFTIHRMPTQAVAPIMKSYVKHSLGPVISTIIGVHVLASPTFASTSSINMAASVISHNLVSSQNCRLYAELINRIGNRHQTVWFHFLVFH